MEGEHCGGAEEIKSEVMPSPPPNKKKEEEKESRKMDNKELISGKSGFNFPRDRILVRRLNH